MQRFDDARDMFITQGWKDLIRMRPCKINSGNSITLRQGEQYRGPVTEGYLKGRLEIIRLLLGYEDQIIHEEKEQTRLRIRGNPIR